MQTVSALPYTRMSIEDFGRQIQAVIQQVKEAASPQELRDIDCPEDLEQISNDGKEQHL